MDVREEKYIQDWFASDKIDFDEFKSTVKSKLMKPWIVISENESVYIGKPDLSSSPMFLVSVKISEELIVSVWHNNIPIPKSNLEWLLGSDLKCTSWSTFDCLISHLNAYEQDMSFETKVKGVILILKNIIEENDSGSLDSNLKFLCEQLELYLMKSPRYSPEMLLWCSRFFFSNPSAYCLVRNSCKLVLPHPYYLRSLLQNFGALKSGISLSQMNYLKNKCSNLNDFEKTVGLLMDEIYIKPGTHYKGGFIEGLANNIDNTEATTIQAFMLSSLF